MRNLPLVLISLALSGCWTGTNLYSASDSRPAIPPGVYRLTADGDQPRVARVIILPNGMTQFDWGEDKESHGFAPLDPEQGTFVVWDEPEPDPLVTKKATEPNQMYALVVRQSDGDFIFYPPNCTEEGAEIARKAGATIEQGMVPTCVFPTRASLEAALRLLPRADESTMRISRIP